MLPGIENRNFSNAEIYPMVKVTVLWQTHLKGCCNPPLQRIILPKY
jgi:hypothetical protein